MRITLRNISLGIAALAMMSACTVHDVDAPAMTGPSTFATSITLRANTNTLIQDGVSQAQITITAVDAQGNPKNIPLRAEIRVDNVAQDFGRLSTKQPTANGTPLIYTAPPPSALTGGQVAQTVQIFVTPMDSGDFASEVPRFVDIQLVPQGIILPTNPTLIARFDISPNPPEAFQSVTFDAGKTTNAGAACGITACSYSWNFGDGASGSGITTTHVYRGLATVQATLTVTDTRGAQATTTQSITPITPKAPQNTFSTSPTIPSTNADTIFNASQVTWDGRTITGYDWDFGDGSAHASGVTATHRYSGAGTFTVVLTLTDSLGATAKIQGTVTITTLGGAKADLQASNASPSVGQRVVFDASASTPSAGSSIVSYRFIYGDGGEDLSNNPIQSHIYNAAGTYGATVVITDSNGKTASGFKTITVK